MKEKGDERWVDGDHEDQQRQQQGGGMEEDKARRGSRLQGGRKGNRIDRSRNHPLFQTRLPVTMMDSERCGRKGGSRAEKETEALREDATKRGKGIGSVRRTCALIH